MANAFLQGLDAAVGIDRQRAYLRQAEDERARAEALRAARTTAAQAMVEGPGQPADPLAAQRALASVGDLEGMARVQGQVHEQATGATTRVREERNRVQQGLVRYALAERRLPQDQRRAFRSANTIPYLRQEQAPEDLVTRIEGAPDDDATIDAFVTAAGGTLPETETHWGPTGDRWERRPGASWERTHDEPDRPFTDSQGRTWLPPLSSGDAGALSGAPSATASASPTSALTSAGGVTADEDLAIRTIMGEALGEGRDGWLGVAGVIRNRAQGSGRSLRDVVLAPRQFEPWQSRRRELESYDPKSRRYQEVAAAVLPVLRGETASPVGGATHFYSPTTQAALGRRPPAWDDGTGTDLGRHRFFTRPGEYGAPVLRREPNALMPQAPASEPVTLQNGWRVTQLPPGPAEQRALRAEERAERAEGRAERADERRDRQWQTERADRRERPMTAQELSAAGLPPGTSAVVDGGGRTRVLYTPSERERLQNGGVPRLSNTDQRTLATLRQNAQSMTDVATEMNRFVGLNRRADTGVGYSIPGAGMVRGGVDPTIAEMRAITERITPLMRQAGSGAMSDRDVQMYRDSIVSVTNPGPANGAIARVGQAAADRAQGYVAYMDWYARTNGSLLGAQEGWDQYARANPLYEEQGGSTRVRSVTPWREWFEAPAPARGGRRQQQQARPAGGQQRPGGEPPRRRDGRLDTSRMTPEQLRQIARGGR